ncbi:MAG: trans-aconitate 2-methyltransferase [Acetobacteraceae bacterium]|nr:trans-aconitate 2-methyltransferase [Acetobacteraceae bacterium]
MSWSPQQYTRFEDDRTRPVRDLLAAVPDGGPARAIDLGCGPGNSTEVLLQRFPAAQVSGLDNSPEMIEAARERLPGVSFALGDILAWDDPGPFGVILSNAVLQWVPGHDRLLPRLVDRLGEGGSVAVQMPDNMAEPAQTLMREIAASGPWASKIGGEQRTSLGTPGWYYEVLRPLCRRVDIWRTTYFHVLPGGVDAIVEWFKGSGLRPFLAPLDPEERAEYLRRYRDGIASAYPVLPDGAALLPFPRLFAVATR